MFVERIGEWMERSTAEKILSASKLCRTQLVDLLHGVQEACKDEEFISIRRAVGHVLANLNDGLDIPVYKQFPDLTPPELKGVRGL